MKRTHTTKICIYNITKDEVIIFSNKKELAKYFNTNWYNVVEWFKKNKVVKKEYAGENYILYKVDYYFTKYYPPGQVNPLPIRR